MTRITPYLLTVIFAISVSAVSVSSAKAEAITLVGVGNFSNLTYSGLPAGDSLSTSASFGVGGGALLDFHLMPMTMFEVGALYLTKKYDVSGNVSGQNNFQGNYLQIPVLLRFRLLPMFYIGLGGFGERAMGTATTGSYPSLTDFGLEGCVGLQLPLAPGMRLRLEGRYLYGLTTLATDIQGTTTQVRDVQAVVGLMFPLY